MTEFTNVFEGLEERSYPYLFDVEITFLDQVRGGTPSDPNVAQGWIKSKLPQASEHQVAELVASTMLERGISEEEAVKYVDQLKHLNGIKRDDQGLYIDGRCAKAMLKEACVVALSANKIQNRGYGATAKSLRPFLAEHCFVVEQRLYLYDDSGTYVTEPTGIDQRFVHVFAGSGISYEEFVAGSHLTMTIETDWPFTREEWGFLLTTAGRQGLGSARSQGFGRFFCSRFSQIRGTPIPESGSSVVVKTPKATKSAPPSPSSSPSSSPSQQ